MSVNVRFIRDDGKQFIIDGTTWKIPEDGLDGFDFVENEISTENNAQGDGSFLSGTRLPKKDRTIKFELMNANLNDPMRQLVRSFFNVKRTLKCYVTYGGETKWCEGVLYTPSNPTKNIYDRLEVSVTILCPMPYLYSNDNFAKNIASIIPMFEFDLEIPEEGIEFDSFAYAKEVELDNDGDFDTYCKAVFVAKGEVVNPVLKKDDKYIRLLDTLEEGDVLIIDLESQPSKVTKNGENIIRLVDRTSNFEDMKFEVGLNTIGYDADNGSNLVDVTIYFNKRYAGM